MLVQDDLVSVHRFVFNPESNGGEQLSLTTKVMADIEGDLYFDQTLSLESYSNSAAFHLGEMLTPESLRKLADELESISSGARLIRSLLGKTREQVIEVMGIPDAMGGTSRKYTTPLIYKYGNLEFTFDLGEDGKLIEIGWKP